MATLYIAPSGVAITAAPVSIATGTALHTILQIASSATRPLKICEWGISFDGSAAATPIKCELLQTDVAATLPTAHTTANVTPYDDPNAPATTVTMGTTATSFGQASAEGTVTATRIADMQLVAPTGQYLKQWPLGREFQLPVSKFLRVRVTAGASVNAYAYVIYEE